MDIVKNGEGLVLGRFFSVSQQHILSTAPVSFEWSTPEVGQDGRAVPVEGRVSLDRERSMGDRSKAA